MWLCAQKIGTYYSFEAFRKLLIKAKRLSEQSCELAFKFIVRKFICIFCSHIHAKWVK